MVILLEVPQPKTYFNLYKKLSLLAGLEPHTSMLLLDPSLTLKLVCPLYPDSSIYHTGEQAGVKLLWPDSSPN